MSTIWESANWTRQFGIRQTGNRQFGMLPSFRPSKIFFVAFFSVTVDGRNLIFGHKLHIGTPYRGKCFLTCQIPTSCLPKSRGIIGEHSLIVYLV